ncbi:MAG TPA: hypothetical protein VFE19_13470 [Jatrophihabitantaceae bacterium]|nr:hypothetical protein [Jatrophihabitantaceae bacterium]
MSEMMSSALNTHHIHLLNHGDVFSASCSCGWASPDDLARSVAAHYAVAHSTICVGDAKMGATADSDAPTI